MTMANSGLKGLSTKNTIIARLYRATFEKKINCLHDIQQVRDMYGCGTA